MVSKKLIGVWVVLDILLLAAGAVALALSLVWRAPNVLMNMVLSAADLTAGTVLGIALLVTFVISIAAIIQRNHVTVGLVILNYALLVDAIGIIVVGTFVWFFTLQERANFHKLWLEATPGTRIILQDQLKCCGYFDGTDQAEIGGAFCQSQAFISGLAADVTTNFCVTPITNFADMTLNNVFTTVYGFMAIVLCLLLASLCVIKKRREDERFKKIDAKRGGRGFV
ncbi:tetraspanin Pls1 family [Crassisporium funariophilum]|nr:tetraspanin Pls1 family [Crassisporium funariophilum]